MYDSPGCKWNDSTDRPVKSCFQRSMRRVSIIEVVECCKHGKPTYERKSPKVSVMEVLQGVPNHDVVRTQRTLN